MEDWLHEEFLDNSVYDWLVSAAIILGVVLFKHYLARFFAWLIGKLVVSKRRRTEIKDFTNLVLPPIQSFLVILSVLIAFNRLQMPEILNFTIYKVKFRDILEAIARGLLIASFVKLLSSIVLFISKILQRRARDTEQLTDDQLVLFFRDFINVILYILGALLILKYSFGFDLTSIVTGLSIIGAAIALAFRESLENLIASFIIFFDKPFTIGDVVKVENITGMVERLGLRSTRIRTTEKTYVTVPNKKMVDTILDNQTLRTQRNVNQQLQLALDTTPNQLQSIISKIRQILQQEDVLDSNVYFGETGGQYHLITIEYFVTMKLSLKQFYDFRQAVNIQLLELLTAENIKLAADGIQSMKVTLNKVE